MALGADVGNIDWPARSRENGRLPGGDRDAANDAEVAVAGHVVFAQLESGLARRNDLLGMCETERKADGGMDAREKEQVIAALRMGGDATNDGGELLREREVGLRNDGGEQLVDVIVQLGQVFAEIERALNQGGDDERIALEADDGLAVERRVRGGVTVLGID